MLSISAKIFKNLLRFDQVTESLNAGTFLRHSVVPLQLTDLKYCHVSEAYFRLMQRKLFPIVTLS